MSLGRLLFLFAVAAAVVVPVRLWLLEGVFVASGSMEPTLPVGRHLFLDKVSHRLRGLRRGDVVVLRSPVDVDEEMIKRVVALPGETVEMRAKKVLVDGRPLEEPYALWKRADERLVGDDMAPRKVPEGHLFVLGDNRDESKDSSNWRDQDGDRVYFVAQSLVRGLVRGIY